MGSTEGNLSILSAVLRGCESKTVESHAVEIGKLISDPDICQCLKPKKQLRLLEVCQVVLDLAPINCSREASPDIFKTIITVLALSNESQPAIKAQGNN